MLIVTKEEKRKQIEKQLFVNEAYLRYYGRSKEDLIGNKFLSHVPVEQHGEIIRYFASFGPGNPILTSQREAVLPDGERRWQEWTDQAFFDENGQLAGFQSVGRDITERKKAEETLKKSEAALRNSKEDLHRLVCAALMRRENVEIVFSKEDVPAAIGKDIGLCLYRVLQESLKNVIAHSRARICRIFLKGADDNICLTVADDGVGFEPVEVRHKPGLGLSSMRERVQLVHGDFSIKSQTGKGAVINVRVPLAGSGA
ncbi:MAG: PAS domain S-box protein [Nitrospiraceae bacterium]|nr:PAS domain S-box protein [Nitrospiraceae bacterium]